MPTGTLFPVVNFKDKIASFSEWKPKPGQFADYKISETTTALDAGTTKVTLVETTGEFVAFPPDYVAPEPAPIKPEKKKKSKGRGPCYQYYDIYHKPIPWTKKHRAKKPEPWIRKKYFNAKPKGGCYQYYDTQLKPIAFPKHKSSQI